MKLALTAAAIALVVAGAVISRSGAATGGTNTATTTDANGTKHLVATDDQGRAVAGYDAVAYFDAGRPTPGDDRYSLEWLGAKWRFASAANRDAFKRDPERYAPQYGGYCAWGVAQKDDLFPIDPTAWRIEDGKLYLNYNADVQKQWLANLDGFIQAGDAKWPALYKAKAGG